jgi:hypothetical protein
MRRLPALALLCLLFPSAAGAQSLSERFTELFTFGNCGQPLCLSVDIVGDHGQHYIPAVTQGENDLLGFVAASIATSLSNLPFTAAAAGIAFEFVDGAPVATSVSAGAIFAERAQTLGRGRLLAGVNVNSLNMQRLRGQSLRDLTFRFAHQNVGAAAMGDPAFENDLIEVRTRLDLNLLVTSVFASFGLLDNVDVGLLVPIVRASLSGSSEATIIPFQRPSPHQFGTPGNTSEFADAASSGSVIGIGDVALRVKANLLQTGATGVGLAADIRLPTGDSEDFLGAGWSTVRVIGIASTRRGSFSPHLNAGVAIRTGEQQNNSIIGAAGFDHLLAEGITLAVDILGDFALGDPQLRLPERVQFDVPTRRVVRLTDIPEQKDHLTDASIGLKMQLPGEYRAVANVLFPLADGGLRPRQLWTLGFERSF